MSSHYINLFVCIACLLPYLSFGQTQDKIELLKQMGMEDIRIKQVDEAYYLTYEDPIYRSNAYGVAQLINRLRNLDSASPLHIALRHDGIYQVAITVSPHSRQAKVNYDTRPILKALKGCPSNNRSIGRLDIVLYPELFLENSWFDKPYGYAVSLSPALEWQLWRGASLTGQVVLPLATNMKDEKKYIRPGVLAFRQRIQLYKQLQAEFAVGNFMYNRYGVDFALSTYSADGHWGIGARGGYTGSSTFYLGKWVIGDLKRPTWNLWGSYFWSYYNLEIKIQALQMVFGDRGGRIDINRYFGDTRIGFYATYTSQEPNGGFSLSIPIPTKKRMKRNIGLRISYPDYFQHSYKARNGRVGLFGFTYETKPDAASLDDFFNPIYLEKQINRLNTKK